MTERGAQRVQRSASRFVIGPSRLAWSPDGMLTLEIDERSAPWARRVSGRVRVTARALNDVVAVLDRAGRHRWKPVAPCARIEVELDAPALRWQGHGYFDANEGDEPIERAFERWDWLRTVQPDGATCVVYDMQPRLGEPAPAIARRFAPDGSTHAIDLPRSLGLPPTRLWRVDRRVRAAAARVRRTLEDTPFYARSLIEMAPGDGAESMAAVHETLDLRRLASPLVQAMLPFRMPRRA